MIIARRCRIVQEIIRNYLHKVAEDMGGAGPSPLSIQHRDLRFERLCLWGDKDRNRIFYPRARRVHPCSQITFPTL